MPSNVYSSVATAAAKLVAGGLFNPQDISSTIMPLPHEIERAKALTDRLHKSVGLCKRFKLQRVQLNVEDAEELLQLLSDSLRTISEFDLVEYDGTCKPAQRPNLPSPT